MKGQEEGRGKRVHLEMRREAPEGEGQGGDLRSQEHGQGPPAGQQGAQQAHSDVEAVIGPGQGQ